MRRLPVFFVLDVSESMVGAPLRQLEEGMERIVRTLRTDPHALETIHIGVIAFAGKADLIVPLIDLVSFYPPRLPIGSGTALGDALDVLMDAIDKNVVQSTPDRRGDWKPVCFLLTDGRPTDETAAAVERWRQVYAGKAHLVVVTLGDRADVDLLRKLTPDVLSLEHDTDEEFRRFVDWISTSVATQSHAVETQPGAAISLDKNRPPGLTLVRDARNPANHGVDDTVVTLPGRCQRSRRPYLIKYLKEDGPGEGVIRLRPAPDYRLDGAYAIDESYFVWSGKGAVNVMVSTDRLDSAPPCPHCGSATAFAMCGCGRLLCINGAGPFECPWCGSRGEFGEGDDAAFDVVRGRG